MPKPAISIKILSSDGRVLAGISTPRCVRRAAPGFERGREAAARPESVPGLGIPESFSGLREGGSAKAPPPLLAPRSPEACGTLCPEPGRNQVQRTPRQGRGRLGEAGSELPVPAPQPFFYPARNHLVYRKYLFALLVGTGVNYSTCERGVIWIKAAPVFIVWVSCLSGA